MEMVRSLLVACVLAVLAQPALAKGWPTPAAGDSASGDPELVLTFDDGPNPKTTPAVLDALAKHHLHVIFFQVGEMVGNKNKKVPDIEARIVREGHIIANHTMTHQDLCKLKKVSDDKAAREIDESHDTIVAVAGIRPVWFRVPYGVRCARVEKLLADRGLVHFHWDLDPQEWKHNDPVKAVKYVEGELSRMGDRNVLLMHDIKTATVKALPEILDWIDAENARRVAAHKRPIRIIQGYDLAAERLPPGLTQWLADAAPDTHGWSQAVANALP
jgi:peptidoglycan/xylan/chitin deacetylase (PgdA/CDA1 family)